MNEIFPVLYGVLLGVTALRVTSSRARRWLLGAGSVAGGVAATIVSGEFRIGWEFLLIDIPLVFIAAAVVVVSVSAAQRRQHRHGMVRG